MDQKKKVRLSDIADRLNISTVTVSKALANKDGVGDDLRKQIKALAEEMGYKTKNTAGVSENGKLTGNIGILIPSRFFSKDYSFYWYLFNHLSSELLNRNYYSIMELLSTEDEQNIILPRMLNDKKVDGIIILGQVSTNYIEAIHSHFDNFILMDFYTNQMSLDCVSNDDYYCSYMLTSYVISQGHKNIRFVGNFNATTSIRDRYMGFQKAMLENNIETTLKDIEWTMGRSGILTPVAIFNPVEIDGSIVERASLHNVSIMKETLGENIYAGQPIKIFKSNMIIPQVFKSISKFDDNNIDLQAKLSFYPEEGTIFNLTTHYFLEIPKVCPICGGETKLVVSESGTVQLICKNENCSGKIINKLDHFCGKKGLNIKGLSKATLEKLLDWGWISSIKDLFNLESKRNEWVLKDGFGYKSVDNILTAIENAKQCNLESYLCAIGIPLVGEHISKLIINKFNTWDSFRKAVDNNYEFYNIQGIGIEIHNSILSFDYSEFDIIANLLHFEEIIENNEKQILKDKIFVITGSLNNYKNRSELQKEIEKYGGKVSSSISKKTSYLINNDINSTSSKNISAKKLGVPIITEENFKNFLTN